jgi:hypothetical protein
MPEALLVRLRLGRFDRLGYLPGVENGRKRENNKPPNMPASSLQ